MNKAQSNRTCGYFRLLYTTDGMMGADCAVVAFAYTSDSRATETGALSATIPKTATGDVTAAARQLWVDGKTDSEK